MSDSEASVVSTFASESRGTYVREIAGCWCLFDSGAVVISEKPGNCGKLFIVCCYSM